MKPTTSTVFFTSILMFLSTLLLSGCFFSSPGPGALTATDPAAPDLLRVGVTTTAPPLIYKKGGKITGLEADFAKQLGVYLKKKVKLYDMPWADQITALENNKIDIIMSGMSITPKRKYRIAFTNPYLPSGQIMLVRLEEKPLFSTGIYSIMNSKYKIGVINSTTGDYFITQTIHGVEIDRFDTADEAVAALKNKKIDVFVYDAPMISYYAAMNESNRLTPIMIMATQEYLAWGVRKDDAELLKNADAFLQQSYSSGQLKKTLSKWLPYLQR